MVSPSQVTRVLDICLSRNRRWTLLEDWSRGETLRKSLSDWHKKTERERWIERSGSKDWKDLFLFSRTVSDIGSYTTLCIRVFFSARILEDIQASFFFKPANYVVTQLFRGVNSKGPKIDLKFFLLPLNRSCSPAFLFNPKEFSVYMAFEKGAKNNLIQSRRRRRPEWMTFQSKKMTF